MVFYFACKTPEKPKSNQLYPIQSLKRIHCQSFTILNANYMAQPTKIHRLMKDTAINYMIPIILSLGWNCPILIKKGRIHRSHTRILNDAVARDVQKGLLGDGLEYPSLESVVFLEITMGTIADIDQVTSMTKTILQCLLGASHVDF
ncbi:MAG: hypothetical protein IPO94_17380 [Saprospiraceae bacterium]|nr:hypothetical protein [Saprospiraceae bacterium]